MVQTQSLTMLGYVGSPCADNRFASSLLFGTRFFFLLELCIFVRQCSASHMKGGAVKLLDECLILLFPLYKTLFFI